MFKLIINIIVGQVLGLSSTGCGSKPGIPTGSSEKMKMVVHDPATDEDIERIYYVNLP